MIAVVVFVRNAVDADSASDAAGPSYFQLNSDQRTKKNNKIFHCSGSYS